MKRVGETMFYALAASVAFIAYFVVFLLNGERVDVIDAAISSITSLIPLAVVAASARAIIVRHLRGASLARQLFGHVALGILFSLLWYWLLMVLIGIKSGGSVTEFVVRAFFDGSAMRWQLLQGFTVYGMVAAVTDLRAQPSTVPLVDGHLQSSIPNDRASSRYFIRSGEDILPVDTREIVSITGAGDYTDVTTTGERHLVSMTLAEFEKALHGGRFIRAHRSHIVNIDRVQRLEPAGNGRLVLHMDTGEVIQTSRAGAKLIKERFI